MCSGGKIVETDDGNISWTANIHFIQLSKDDGCECIASRENSVWAILLQHQLFGFLHTFFNIPIAINYE